MRSACPRGRAGPLRFRRSSRIQLYPLGVSPVEEGEDAADRCGMATPQNSMQRAGRAGRSGIIGAAVAAFAFFDGVFLGAPIALLAASFRPLVVYGVATVVVILVVIACCSW